MSRVEKGSTKLRVGLAAVVGLACVGFGMVAWGGSDDPQRRAALSTAARTRAAAFDWPVVAADVLRVYRAAIAADPRRVPGRTAAGSR